MFKMSSGLKFPLHPFVKKNYTFFIERKPEDFYAKKTPTVNCFTVGKFLSWFSMFYMSQSTRKEF